MNKVKIAILSITTLFVIQFSIYAGGALGKAQDIEYLNADVTLVSQGFNIAMSDHEFDAWLLNNGHFFNTKSRQYFEPYKASGVLRQKCYIPLKGITQQQDIHVGGLLRLLVEKKPGQIEYVIGRIADHEYNHKRALAYTLGTNGSIVQTEIPDTREKTAQALRQYVQNISQKK